MKRIGIITIQKCDNFGADLQAYALGAKLRNLGYEAENIDYLFYKHPDHRTSSRERPIFRHSLQKRIKESFARIIRAWDHAIHPTSARHELFEKFFLDFVPTGKCYPSVDSLYENPPDYDVYMVGSDQVWNPGMGSNIKPFFLDFVPEGKRCVSYASSIAIPSISPSAYSAYKKLLSRFYRIGVREASSERIIAGMGLDAPVRTVLDPTLLLTAEEWQKVAHQPDGVSPRSYIVEYNLGHHPAVHALADRWARKLCVRVVDITDAGYGPSEFVWLMANARAAVCCSFHGTVFSVLNKIPFYSAYSNGTASNGGRIAAFANSLGLGDRMVLLSALDKLDPDESIDYAAAYAKLESARQSSLSFLIDSIENAQPNPASMVHPKACYAVWTKDLSVRKESTSGGAFYLIAENIIRKGGMVFGAAFENDFKHVSHAAASNLDELKRLMKSKYVYSDFTKCLPEMSTALTSGMPVLFVGTPCQVAVVKAKFKERGNLITADFVCHGTPRADVFAKWIEHLEARYHSKIVGYEFRNKKIGWNFSQAKITFASGKVVYLKMWRDPYFTGFALNVFLRECCYTCRYAGLPRVSDITIGDCWRVATSHPEYDDGMGTSMVLVNTAKGEALFEEVRQGSSIKWGAYDFDQAVIRNQPLMSAAVCPAYARPFKDVLARSGSFVQAAACYFTTRRRLKSLVRGFVKQAGWSYFRHHQ